MLTLPFGELFLKTLKDNQNKAKKKERERERETERK